MIAVALMVAMQLAAADPASVVGDINPPPETPLPPPPPPLPLAPDKPVAKAPDARELLTACKQPSFTDCFRLWHPPVPPPTSQDAAAGPQGQPSPPASPTPRNGKPQKADKQQDEPLVGPAPKIDTAADQVTYDALVKAIKDVGLSGKVVVPEPPRDGAVTVSSAPSAKPKE